MNLRRLIFLIALGSQLGIYAQSIFPFKKSDLWGYIDSTGKEVIPPQYPLAGFFYDGLAYAQIGDALGYIDEKGNEVIKSKYPAAYNFNEGYASVMEDEDWGVIDKTGNMVIEPKFAGPVMFHNGLARFKLDRSLFSTYGFVNTKGDTVISPTYEKAGEFSNGMCMVSGDGYRYGYMNEKGIKVIPEQFEIGATFKVNGEYDFSDKEFSNGYVVVEKDGKFGLMDKAGKMVLPYKFQALGKYSEGLLPAKKDSLFGFIDLTGNWVIKPAYKSAEAFHHGLAAVSKGPFLEEKWGFINRQGKIIIPLTIYANYSFNKPMEFWNGVVACYVEKDVFGYINREGRVIWKMQ